MDPEQGRPQSKFACATNWSQIILHDEWSKLWQRIGRSDSKIIIAVLASAGTMHHTRDVDFR